MRTPTLPLRQRSVHSTGSVACRALQLAHARTSARRARCNRHSACLLSDVRNTASPSLDVAREADAAPLLPKKKRKSQATRRNALLDVLRVGESSSILRQNVGAIPLAFEETTVQCGPISVAAAASVALVSLFRLWVFAFVTSSAFAGGDGAGGVGLLVLLLGSAASSNEVGLRFCELCEGQENMQV